MEKTCPKDDGVQREQWRADVASVTAPRQIDHGAIFYVTVRAVNRSFRFVPDRAVRRAIMYTLAVTLERYRAKKRIQLHEWCFMSNHYHLLGTDLGACLPDFIRDFNALLSRQLNAIRGMRGTNIEKDFGLVTVHSAERVVDHAVYTLANPVAAHLCATARQWYGVTSARMEYGVPVKVTRPTEGLWSVKRAHTRRRASKRSKRASYAGTRLPAVVDLVIDRPSLHLELEDAALRELVRGRVGTRETEIEKERIEKGISVAGRKRVVSMHFLTMPGSEELFARRPTFSAKTDGERKKAAQQRRAFITAYIEARDRFREGDRDVVFPRGTFLMRCRYSVRCEPAAHT